MGECFFWYQPTRVVPDKRPLNGCVCVCVGPKQVQAPTNILTGSAVFVQLTVVINRQTHRPCYIGNNYNKLHSHAVQATIIIINIIV